MSSLALFTPFLRNLNIDVIYDDDKSSKGVIEFSKEDDVIIFSERFESDLTVSRVIQKFMNLSNRHEFTYSTEGITGDTQINQKYFQISYFIPDRATDVLTSIQTRLIFLKTFQKEESKEMIAVLERTVQYMVDTKDSPSTSEYEEFLDRFEQLLDPAPEDVDPDSGYQSGTQGTPSVVTPARIDSPFQESADTAARRTPAENETLVFPRGVERVISSLRIEALRREQFQDN